MSDLKRILTGACLIVESTKDTLEKTNTKLLEQLQTMKESGILLIFDEGTKVPDDMKERCHIIDGLGKGLGQTSVEKAGSLVELSFVINRELNRSHYSYIYIDCVNALKQWNPPGDIQKFAHFIVSKLRAIEIGGVFVVEKEDEASEEMFSEFVDDKIYL